MHHYLYLWLEHDIILECNGIQFVSSERFSFIRKECNKNSMLFHKGIYYPIRWYEGKNDPRKLSSHANGLYPKMITQRKDLTAGVMMSA